MKDPGFWFPVNATIDGIDPWSESPIEQAKYAVYRMRLQVEAMKAAAGMTAAAAPEQAGNALKDYLAVALPEDPMTAKLRVLAKQDQAKTVEQMAPIHVSRVKFGAPTVMPKGGSMVKPQDLARLTAKPEPAKQPSTKP